jgi:hypothetical protein
MLDVVEEYLSFQCTAGNLHTATAGWQALFEFNVDVPTQAQGKSNNVLLRFFEAYWDSGWPRCGHSRSCGWQNSLTARLTNGPGVDIGSSGPGPCSPVDESQTAVWGVLDPATIPPTATEATAVETPKAAGGAVGGASISDAMGPGGAPLIVGDNSSDNTLVRNDKVGGITAGKRMVYSIMHGYMIPVTDEADDDTSALYQKILGELREENGAAEKAASKADKTQRKTLQERFVPADDPLMACQC